ncbi:MAG: thioesterase family protein [Desulfohalobiaceae bacterium]|nr:thioesterase family protein [Desulfohalobiaceae bacterium]
MAEHLKLEQFPARIEIPILWGDMDAFRHVNNTRFFRYMESARVKYIELLDLFGLDKDAVSWPILAEASCKFIAPLAYPDSVIVGCRTSAIRSPEELEQEYLLVSSASNLTVAVGWARIAAYDFSSLRKSRFPEKVLAAINELEGGDM